MSKKSSNLGRIGAYLLAGSLAVGSPAYAQPNQNAQPNNKIYIYEDLKSFYRMLFPPEPPFAKDIIPFQKDSLKDARDAKEKEWYNRADSLLNLQIYEKEVLGEDFYESLREKGGKDITGLKSKKSKDLHKKSAKKYTPEKSEREKDRKFEERLSRIERELTEAYNKRLRENSLKYTKPVKQATAADTSKGIGTYSTKDTSAYSSPADTSRPAGKDTLATGIEQETAEEEIRGPRFGLEGRIGNDGEKTVGIFGNAPLTSWMNLEGYANYSIAYGNPYLHDVKTEATQRARLLIGPSTFENRGDKITTTLEEKARAEAGMGITFRLTDRIEIPFRAGVKLLDGKETKDGESTISHERNGQPLGETKTITNSKESTNQINRLSLSAGAMYNINKNVSVGGSFNRTGKHNSGSINLKVGF